MRFRFEARFPNLAALATGVAALLTVAGAQAQSVSDPDLVVQPYLSDLSLPTGMRFFAPDQGFVIEKESGLVKRFDGGTLSTVLDLNVQGNNERGLLGIAVDPNFAPGSHVYLYYSATTAQGDYSQDDAQWAANRLARYQWNGTTLVPTGLTRNLGSANASGFGNGPNHNAGPLLFGPDGKLYGTTGDLNRSRAEQNDKSFPGTSAGVGGIYRLNPDLSAPADNPITGSFAQWYAYGVRNSFGLAFDPVTGKLWDTENGPSSFDEINLVSPGFNSGWNKIMGPDSRDPQNAPDDLVVLPNSAYSDPEFSFLDPVAVTSIQFLADSAWGPEYDDAVLVGDNNTKRLYLLRLNGARDSFVLSGALADLVADTGSEASQLVFGEDFGVVTDLQVGPDGALYVTSLSHGTVYRIAPVPEPAGWLLMAVGLFLLVLARWRPGKRAPG